MTFDSNNVLLPEQTLIDTNQCKPVPVALIANPFAHKFAYASQMGRYNLQGNDWNPLNPFCRYIPLVHFLLSQIPIRMTAWYVILLLWLYSTA